MRIAPATVAERIDSGEHRASFPSAETENGWWVAIADELFISIAAPER